MIETLSQLQAAFAKANAPKASNWYNFYLMPQDATAIIRFLPDKNRENPMGFVVKKTVHILDINENERKTTPCLGMYGESCPICAVSQQFYKANDEENGKRFWKKDQHIAQILVVKDPIDPAPETGENSEGQLRFINLGFQLFGVIKTAFKTADFEGIPYNFKGGYDFMIVKNQQGKFPNYAMGSGFVRKQSDLTADQIAYLEEHMVDLSTLIPANPGIEETEKILHAALTGETYVEPSKDNDNTANTNDLANQIENLQKETAAPAPEVLPAAKEGKVTREVAKEAVAAVAAEKIAASEEVSDTPATSDDTDALDDDATDILAKIRSRRKGKLTD